jgi:hypothetical protein
MLFATKSHFIHPYRNAWTGIDDQYFELRSFIEEPSG